MVRRPRLTPAGYVYHVINRGFLKAEIFADNKDYSSFLRLLALSQKKYNMRVCSYCLMPNHWHLALWPTEANALSTFMQKLTSHHVIAWRSRWGTEGHLYQGRFKSFPVQSETHYYRLVRYIEQNPLRAALATHPLGWQWSSAWLREQQFAGPDLPVLSNALPLHRRWLNELTVTLPSVELDHVRTSVGRSRPFGDDAWTKQTASALGLEWTLQSHGGARRAKTVQGA